VWLVLCSSDDLPALRAYEELQRRDLCPLELVVSESLGRARAWEHRVGRAGVSTKIELADGRILRNSQVQGVLNRLLSPHQDPLRIAAAEDRDFAAAELMAFYLSWLYGLKGVVINRPSPRGLCGGWRHTSEWIGLASRAGLAVPPYRQTGRDSPDSGYRSLAPPGSSITRLIVLAGKVFGAAIPDRVADAATKLAKDAGAEMLGIDVYLDPDSQWTFAAASPIPDLSIGGQPLLDHLACVLRNGARP
jgi:hypothetical protein